MVRWGGPHSKYPTLWMNYIISHPVLSWITNSSRTVALAKKKRGKKFESVWSLRWSNTDTKDKKALDCFPFFLNPSSMTSLFVTYTQSLSTRVLSKKCKSKSSQLMVDNNNIRVLIHCAPNRKDFSIGMDINPLSTSPGLETKAEKPARLWPVAWLPGQSPAIQPAATWRSWYWELVGEKNCENFPKCEIGRDG